MNKVKRPILRYHGGKWVLAPWIISHFPKHKIYVEPYGGAASVLLRKSRSDFELYNELNSEITNLFKVVRNQGKELAKLLWMTPFSKSEFEESYTKAENDLEQARRTIVRSFMGFGTCLSAEKKTGFRRFARQKTAPSKEWTNYPESLLNIVERFRGVTIESEHAFEVIKRNDTAGTLFYVDPPYTMDTRYGDKMYKFEMSEQDHIDLSKVLKSVEGTVVLSGYSSDLYNDLYNDWHVSQKDTYADGARKRVETIWMNRPIKSQISLF